MRRIGLFFLMIGVLMFNGVQVKAEPEPVFADYQLEQQGLIQFLYGYNYITGDQASYQTVFNQNSGLITDYQVDLAGRLFNQWTSLAYSFLKNPGEKLNWTMNFQNKWIHATYDHNLNFQFPQVHLGFGENRLDGFFFETNQPGITLVHGQEKYVPVTKSLMVTPSENKLSLFDVPPSFADVLEDSEVLVLNGQRLERDRDYTINYLRGEVELLTPVAGFSTLEAKYLMIPTKEEATEEPGQLQGSILSKSWNSNIVSVYYLERRHKSAPLYMPPMPGESREIIFNPAVTSKSAEANRLLDDPLAPVIQVQQVKGVAAQINQGPIDFKGEIAVSSEPGSEPITAYDIDFQLTDEKLDLSYEMREIPEAFQEVGVNQLTAGNSQKLQITERAEEDIHLGIEINNFENQKDQKIYQTSIKQGDVKIFATPNQYGQMIVVDIDQKLTDLLDPSKSGSKKANDLLLGYTYETRPLTFSVQQSIQDQDQRSLQFKAKYGGFYVSGNYELQNLWEYKMHKSQLIWSYDPIPAFGLSSIVDYERPKGIELGNLRLNLNSNWIPIPALQFHGGYSYNTHVDYKQLDLPIAIHRYSLKTTYLKDNILSDLTLIRRKNLSTTVVTEGYEAEWNTNWSLWNKYQLDYKLNYEYSNQKPKQVDMAAETESIENIQNVSLGYLLNPNWTLSAGVGSNIVGYTSIIFNETSGNTVKNSTFDLGLYYQGEEENHLLTTEAGWEFKPISTIFTLNNQLSIPLWGGLLDHGSKIEMNWEARDIYHYQANLDYRFPQIWHLTPEVGYKSDFTFIQGNADLRTGVEAKKERQEVIRAALKYNWQENRGIFIEGKREILNSWSDPTTGFTSLGIFTGIEMTY